MISREKFVRRAMGLGLAVVVPATMAQAEYSVCVSEIERANFWLAQGDTDLQFAYDRVGTDLTCDNIDRMITDLDYARGTFGNAIESYSLAASICTVSQNRAAAAAEAQSVRRTQSQIEAEVRRLEGIRDDNC